MVLHNFFGAGRGSLGECLTRAVARNCYWGGSVEISA